MKKQFKRASMIEGSHITAGEKKATIALVNENKPEYFGRFMKAGRIKLKVEPKGKDIYKVTIAHNHKYGLLGAYESNSEFTLKLS